MCLMEKSPGLPFTHDGVGFHSTGGGVTSDVSTRGRQSSIPYPYPLLPRSLYTGTVYMFILNLIRVVNNQFLFYFIKTNLRKRIQQTAGLNKNQYYKQFQVVVWTMPTINLENKKHVIIIGHSKFDSLQQLLYGARPPLKYGAATIMLKKAVRQIVK